MSRKRRALAPMLLLALGTACSRAAPEPPPFTPPQAANAPAIDCRRDISAGDCAQANASLQQDAAALAVPPAIAPIADEPEQSADARAAALMAGECQLQQQVLDVLKQRERGEGEMLSDEERAQIPAQIEHAQSYLDNNCK